MTTKWNSFWTRLSGKLKSKPGSVEMGEDLPKVGQDGLLTESLFGRAYWYFFLPFHRFIFKGLIRQIEERSRG